VLAGLLVLGRWSDGAGRRPALLAGLGCAAVSAVCFLLANGLPLLLVGRFLSGICAGLFTSAATVALVELGGRGIAPALAATVCNMLGLGLGPLIAGLLALVAPAPLRTTYVVHLVLLVPAALLLLLRVPETAPGRRHYDVRPQRLSVPPETRAVFLPASVGGFAGFLVLGFFSGVTPAVLGGELDVHNPLVIGVVVFSVLLASAVGQACLPLFPARRALPIACGLLVAGSVVIAVSVAVAALWVLLLGSAVAGFGQGLTLRSGVTAVTAASPADQRGAITATLFFVYYIAISVPVIGTGLLAQLRGIETAGISAAVVAAVIALLAMVAGLRLARQPVPEAQSR